MNQQPVELLFCLDHPDAIPPVVAYEGTSAAFDLHLVEDIVIPARGTKMGPVGIRILIPNGYYVELRTRSGHGLKKGLQLHHGVIDAGYKGPWGVMVYNHSDDDVSLAKGDALVQCLIKEKVPCTFTKISPEEFDDIQTARGFKGWGSTDGMPKK